MWKNVAIIIVALLIIREINLMQNSLILSPDSQKVIANDQTIISNIASFIKHEKDLFFKKPFKDKNNSKNKKVDKNLPTLDDMEPILSNLKSLEDVESISTSQNKPQQTLKQTKIKPHQKENKIESLALFEKNETKTNNLPTSYQSAQEKVFAILHQMGKR